MGDQLFKKIGTTTILVLLVVLSFFILKPILLSILMGFLLAFLFYPIYQRLNKNIKSKNLSAFTICIVFALIIFLLLWLLVPIIINQSIQIYVSSQQLDFVTPLKKIFPSVFSSESFSQEIGSAIYSFTTKITNGIMNGFANLIKNFPILFFQFLVVFFTFFFTLKDQEKLMEYVKSLLPFSKDVEHKLFKSSKDITMSVLYGQIILGIVQGIVLGIGFFIFGVPNALFLMLIACVAGIFPIVGTTLIWIPTVIYLFATGNILSAFGIMVFGMVASSIDGIVKPIIVSKRTNLHSAVVLIGMVGGLFFFGLLGVILGPLILAYLFIILEIYRDRRIPGVIIKNPKGG